MGNPPVMAAWRDFSFRALTPIGAMSMPERAVTRRTTIGVGVPLAIALFAMVARYAGLPAGACFDVAWTTSALGALVGSNAARKRAHGRDRTRWTLWMLAMGCWLFGQLAWDVFGVIGFSASPNVADIGWWACALLVIASMLQVPRGSRSIQVVAIVESLPVIVAAIALCLAELWTTVAHSHLALAPKISALIYPVLYVSAAMLTLRALLGDDLRGRRALPVRLVAFGIGAEAISFILWSSRMLEGTYVTGGTPLDAIWVIGLSAIAIGGLLAARAPEQASEHLSEPSNVGVILPACTFFAIFAALAVMQLRGGAPHGAALTLRLGVFFSGMALIARSTLLGQRMRVMLERERATTKVLAEREAELAALNARLVEDSRHDPLTGIRNRRALSDDMPMYEALRREQGERIALAVCDVDQFKLYNDRLGHLAGDQALRMIAATARAALRPIDAAYRFGGEELLLVLRDVSAEDAIEIAERVRVAIEHAALPHPDADRRILTTSIGVACGDVEFGQLLAQADAALYDAKRAGRNQVSIANHASEPVISVRRREDESEEPVPRHLRSMLAVSRAAASSEGTMPVLQALAEAIRSELWFHMVAVSVPDDTKRELRVAVFMGDEEARATLLEATRPLSEWQELLATAENIHGASWLKDMLLMPLRSASGELLGLVTVDRPLLGRRPSDEEIGALMAVVDHAGLALDQVQREDSSTHDLSDELRLAAVMLLAETIDLRDPKTALHARTVGQFARGTASVLGLTPAQQERIHAAGVLHDLGKLGIADAILQKPGPLEEAEWQEIRGHPEVGARILGHAGMHDIADWVRAHHERVDGRGYPKRISGGEIPLEARILAVADSYEAMIADRPYRSGITAEQACEELLRCAGSQFDPEVVDAFLQALDARGLGSEPQTLEQVA
jgi:diguanylate cyclase (GGDEF)-like protein